MTNGWETWHDWNARVMRPLSAWFAAATGATSGQRLLDAACGTGVPALYLAERLRPGGKLVALDVSAEMLGAARRKGEASGADNVEFRELDLAALDFPDACFDGVSCAFGLMFCRDPARAASELWRVLGPGGRFAIAVWDQLEQNPYFATLFGVLGRHAPLPAFDPESPNPFRLSPPGRLEAVLHAGGFGKIDIESREVMFEFESVAQHWQVSHDLGAPVRAAVAKLSESELADLHRALADALVPYLDAGRVRIPTRVLCASGRKDP